MFGFEICCTNVIAIIAAFIVGGLCFLEQTANRKDMTVGEMIYFYYIRRKRKKHRNGKLTVV